MWCLDCQQDVPGVSLGGNTGAIVCARCSRELPRSTQPFNAACQTSESADSVPGDISTQGSKPALHEEFDVQLDDWQLTDELQRAQRAVHRHADWPNGQSCMERMNASEASGPPIGTTATGAVAGAERLAQPHRYAHSGHVPADTPHFLSHHKPTMPSITRIVAWILVMLGIGACGGGFVVSGLSFLPGWDHLWSLGLPVALIGQAGLLLGLVLQLDGMWRVNRHTTQSLEELDMRVAELSQATGRARPFEQPAWPVYSQHAAEVSSPHLLVADLKGRVDQLAERISRQSG